jgi:hypothetical protein
MFVLVASISDALLLLRVPVLVLVAAVVVGNALLLFHVVVLILLANGLIGDAFLLLNVVVFDRLADRAVRNALLLLNVKVEAALAVGDAFVLGGIVVPSLLAVGNTRELVVVIVPSLLAVGDAFAEFLVPVVTRKLANRHALALLWIPTQAAFAVNDHVRDTFVGVVVPVLALAALVVGLVGFGSTRWWQSRDDTQEGSGEREDGSDMHCCKCVDTVVLNSQSQA